MEIYPGLSRAAVPRAMGVIRNKSGRILRWLKARKDFEGGYLQNSETFYVQAASQWRTNLVCIDLIAAGILW